MTSVASAETPTAPSRTGRPCLYLLYLRQFSNVKPAGRRNGSAAENGVGKFADLDDRAIGGLAALGITHVWLLGVLRHATGTPYPQLGLPADPPEVLKGVAGSPFAVRDCFDVCPDFATDPVRRLAEFGELIARFHRHGLKVLIDFVPNHVARGHRSVVRPDLDFGRDDDRTRFFSPDNNFFYLPGPLRLPGRTGGFAGELDHAKVTGNNVVGNAPGREDWYETVKLNFGVDFTRGPVAADGGLERSGAGGAPPDTWRKLDAVLAHWQELGVDGFRCDMAHWVPAAFWSWAIARCRGRRPDTYFLAEAYDGDPGALNVGDSFAALLGAGFDAVYDDRATALLQDLYAGPKWANDLDAAVAAGPPSHGALRYAENHDRVRLASPHQWGGLGSGVGRPVSAVLFGLGSGPLLLHNGQEVGEPALARAGFGGGDGRTSIFDYGVMPELAKWVNGHRYDGGGLAEGQRALRSFYARLVRLCQEPAFAHGKFVPFNPANRDNPHFGRLPGEPASGHWLYAFLRHDAASGQAILVVANLHGRETMRAVRLRFPPDAIAALAAVPDGKSVEFWDRLAPAPGPVIRTTVADLCSEGLGMGDLPPLHAGYWQIGRPPVS